MKGIRHSFLLLLLMVYAKAESFTMAKDAQRNDVEEKDPLLPTIDDVDFLDDKDWIAPKISSTVKDTSEDNAASGIVCIPGITKYSINGSSPEYIECVGHHKPVAILKKCPSAQIYNPENEKCEAPPAMDGGRDAEDIVLQLDNGEEEMSDEGTRQIIQPTFGKEVFIGNPFDARTQILDSSDFFWNAATVKAKIMRRNTFSSNLDFSAVKSTLDRMAKLDIDASLKMDFLGGLVKVEGSAKYYKEAVLSEDIANVVMEAHYKTRTENLPSSTPPDDINLCKRTDITHVVTGISYGMDAYFDFRSEIRSEDSKEKIEGQLKIAIKSIPSVKVEAGVDVKLDGTLKETSKRIRAKVRGDFILKEQPTTYSECVLVYKNLASHLGPAPDYRQAVPKRMTLTPVKRICSASRSILLKIKDSVIIHVTRMMDKIEKTKIKAKTIQHKGMVQMYTPYEKLMNLFVAKVEEFELSMQAELQSILPQMRSGTKGETDLNKVLQKYYSSPFNFDSAKTFLKTREKEIRLLNHILNPKTYKDKNVYLKSKETENTIESLIFEKRKIMILKLNVLPNRQLVEKFLAGTAVDESTSWFNNHTMIATMGGLWRRFKDFAVANKGNKDTAFIVEAYPFNQNFVNVWAMNDNRIVSTKFDIPSTPPSIFIISNDYNRVVIRVQKPTNKWVTKFYVRKTVFLSKLIQGSQITSEMAFNANNRYIIAGLEPNTRYLLTVAYHTQIGNTNFSEAVDPVLTKPCSPPANVRSPRARESSIAIAWDTPLSIGKGVSINHYSYVLKKGTKTIKSGKSTSRSLDLRGLESATIYTISIRAVTLFNKSEESSSDPSERLKVVTAPARPSPPNVVTSFTSAHVSWTPPKVADGAIVQRYVVRYTQLDSKGKDVSTQTVDARNSPATIGDLVQGLSYAISIKVITSMGESDFSPRTVGTAKYKTTELSNIQKTLESNMGTKITALKSSMSGDIGKLKESLKQMVKKMTEKQPELNGLAEKMKQEKSRMDLLASKVNQEEKKLKEIATQTTDQQHRLAKVESTTIATEGSFNFPDQRTNSRNKLLATIPRLSASYSVEFEFYPTRFQGDWSNIMHMTSTGTNCCVPGSRIPAVFFHRSKSSATKNKVHICSFVNGNEKNGNNCFDSGTIVPRNQWTKFIIEQRRDGVGYRYTVTVRNVVVASVINTTPREFANVKVYGADNSYNAAPGNIRNLVINPDGAATIAGIRPFNYPGQRLQKRNQLLSTIPKLSRSYRVEFELRLVQFQPGYTSIIHLTTKNNCCDYGERIPAVYFWSSASAATKNRFHICSAVSGNGNYCSDSKKTVRRGHWTKVSITQRRDGARFKYTVKVGNDVIRSVYNTQPREFYNVKVYSADPWSANTNAYIKNLVIDPNEG